MLLELFEMLSCSIVLEDISQLCVCQLTFQVMWTGWLNTGIKESKFRLCVMGCVLCLHIVNMYVYLCVCVCVCVNRYTSMNIYICVCVCVCVNRHWCDCVCVCVRVCVVRHRNGMVKWTTPWNAGQQAVGTTESCRAMTDCSALSDSFPEPCSGVLRTRKLKTNLLGTQS